MKLKSTLLAAALVVFAASAPTVFAADKHHADAKADKTEAAKTDTGEAAKPAKKKMKKHSHMTEKTGMPMPEPAAATDKQESMKDMPIYDHTKDRY